MFIYAFLFLSSVIENLFPPYPGDTITLVGTYLAVTNRISFPIVYAAVNLGGLTGALILFYLGKTKGRKFFLMPGRNYYNPQKLSKVEEWMAKYGSWLIIGGRFFTGIRSLISIAAGIGDFGSQRFSALTLLSFAIWNGILMTAVFLMKDRFEDIGSFFSMYSKVILVALSIALTLYLISRWIKFKKGKK